MPFTGSHPAAVLPLLRTPLPAAGLVIGSMAPDVPYYLPVSLGLPTHSAVGIVTVDLLLGALTWLVWTGLLAAPALAVAPRAVRGRLVGMRPGLASALHPDGRLRAVGLLVAALVVGAATHVGWDELTHEGRWGPQHLAVLADGVAGKPGYQWAQYASGLLGALALGAWLLGWWRRTPFRPVPPVAASRWVWPALLAVGAIAGLAAAFGARSLRSAAFAGATNGGAAVAVVAGLMAVAWHVRASGVRED